MAFKQIKKSDNVRYGFPYMGSKQKVIERIATYFPPADNFYDLFGGGFSVTHYMMMHRRRSFKNFHYNEINQLNVELVKDAIAGKYNYDVFKPEFITREMFFEQKEKSGYVKFLWSFGNNGKCYIFGEDIEQGKKSLHNAIIFGEYDSFFKDVTGLDKIPDNLDMTARRLYVRNAVVKIGKFCKQLQRLQQLQQLQQLEQLQRLQQLQQLQQLERLQQLQQLQRLSTSSLSYDQVEIKPNSVIYCDIPYKGTAEYDKNNPFNHAKFFDWASEQKNPVFISEYNVDDSRIKLLAEFKHRSTLSANSNNKVSEKLYGNQVAFDIIEAHKNRSR